VTIQDARPDTKLTLVNSFGLSAVLFIRRFSGGVADWRVYQPLAGLTPNSKKGTFLRRRGFFLDLSREIPKDS
jgi:hypothetical protein